MVKSLNYNTKRVRGASKKLDMFTAHKIQQEAALFGWWEGKGSLFEC